MGSASASATNSSGVIGPVRGASTHAGFCSTHRFFIAVRGSAESKRPAETMMRGPSTGRLARRLPQWPQKPRSFAGEERYQRMCSSPSQRTAERSAAKRANELPCSFWQSAQWQTTTPALEAGIVTRTRPQWQAPARTSAVGVVSIARSLSGPASR